ncbi:MAG: hypothetical protein AAGJ79_03845 [Verrucomicrobiota bacterium]
MKTGETLLWAMVAGVFCGASMAYADLPPRSNLSREPDAVYVEDFLEDEVTLKVVGDFTIFRSLQAERTFGKTKTGESAVLLAMSDKAFRVRTKAHHGQVAGWASIKAFEGPDKEFITNLRKTYERYRVVQELIESGQVALGMTINEVTQVLGVPSEKSTRLDKEGRHDEYSFIKTKRVPQYDYVPDAFGRLVKRTIYVEVEVGRTTVSFKNEVVESIEDKETDPNLATGTVKIVPQPIELY